MHRYEIEDKYKSHVLLRRKGEGDAAALVGKTAMLLFYVNDQESVWNEAAQKNFSQIHCAAMKTVMDLAKERSISLTIDTFVEEVTVPFRCGNDKGSKEWCEYIISRYSKKLFKGYRKHYKETLGYDQIAVAFAFNKEFRAFAHFGVMIVDTEYSALDYPIREKTIIHELLHQFGAMDVYPLEKCMESVRKLRYRSIMGCTGGIYFDSLTAYAIGWSEEIDEEAVALLEATKHLTSKEIIDFQERS